MFLPHVIKIVFYVILRQKSEFLLGFRSNKRVRAWRNGLRPLKKRSKRAKKVLKGKERVVAKLCQEPRPVAKQK